MSESAGTASGDSMAGSYDRVAVVADVHGNPWALRAVLDEIRREAVDLIVDCGDLLLGPWPAEVRDAMLETLAPAEARPFDSLDGRSRLQRLDDEVSPS
jgi:Calcineurin-like phosphoesterase superfamily domain